jgi:hypothetical protein
MCAGPKFVHLIFTLEEYLKCLYVRTYVSSFHGCKAFALSTQTEPYYSGLNNVKALSKTQPLSDYSKLLHIERPKLVHLPRPQQLRADLELLK